MAKSIREPRQERSIEKKNKLIQAGYELFSEVGYYNTNTAEIAKRAGVSTGIVYGYFKDKRDILLSVLDIYLKEVTTPILRALESLTPPIDYAKIIPTLLDITTKAHREHSHIHEALHSMTSSDEAVERKFRLLEDNLTDDITSKLIRCDVKDNHLKEKVHLAINIIQSYSHECIYDQHMYIDYKEMRHIVIDTLITLFSR